MEKKTVKIRLVSLIIIVILIIAIIVGAIYIVKQINEKKKKEANISASFCC